MKNIFNNENYILCKVGYSVIHLIELETENTFYFEKNNLGKYSRKGLPIDSQEYPNLLQDINSMTLNLIEKFLWKNLEEPINENHLKYMLERLFPERRIGLSVDLCYSVKSIENRKDIMQYCFENKIKPDEIANIVKKGLLHYISKKHILSGKMYDKRYTFIGKTYVHF